MLKLCGKKSFPTSASVSALMPMPCQRIIDSIGIGIHNSQLPMPICTLISLLIPMLTYHGKNPLQTPASASALMPMPWQQIIDGIGIGVHHSQLPMPKAAMPMRQMPTGCRLAPVNSLDPSESVQCNCSLARVTRYNVASLCEKIMRNELWSLTSYKVALSWYITLSPAECKHPLALYFAGTGEKY